MSFTNEYATLTDYIIGITARIWEGRGIGLIRRWYAPDVVMHTAFGDSFGVDLVVSGTEETLHAFPDRRLLGEDVIYSGGERGNGYSSHRIVSTMHHRGDGSFGAATGKPAWARTVADCLMRDGIIVEEWLVRDQAAIALQLGIDPMDWGRRRAGVMAVEGAEMPMPDFGADTTVIDDGSEGARLAAGMLRVWNDADLSALRDTHDPAVNLHLPCGRAAFGHDGIDGWTMSYLAAFPDARLSIETILTRPDPGRPTRAALRWRLAGSHTGRGAFGPPSGAPVNIPGITHLEIAGGKVVREFVLVDELAIWTAIALSVG